MIERKHALRQIGSASLLFLGRGGKMNRPDVAGQVTFGHDKSLRDRNKETEYEKCRFWGLGGGGCDWEPLRRRPVPRAGVITTAATTAATIITMATTGYYAGYRGPGIYLGIGPGYAGYGAGYGQATVLATDCSVQLRLCSRLSGVCSWCSGLRPRRLRRRGRVLRAKC